MKRSVLILSFSVVFLIGAITSSPDTVKAAESGWQAAVEDILVILNQDQFQLDIVTSNPSDQNDNGISILLRNDNNKYFRTDISPDISPDAVNVADINNDGHQDIISVGRQFEPVRLSLISVFLGNGDGTFQTEKLSPTNANARPSETTAIAHFNGDGFLDFISIKSGGVVVHLGDGTGLFGAEIFSSLPGTFPFTVNDFNNDGKQDVVGSLGSDGDIIIAKGVGNGTFEPHSIIGPTAGRLSAITSADINNDGNQDIVTATTSSGSGNMRSVSIFLGNGDATFQPVIIIENDNETPNSIAVGDLNNDGNQDVVTGNNFENLSVLLGNGDGTFLQERNFATAEGGRKVVKVADLNNDGNQDVVVLNTGDRFVSIHFGDGQGHFDPKVNDYRVHEEANSMVIGDFKTLP